jgi:hypothetical protein
MSLMSSDEGPLAVAMPTPKPELEELGTVAFCFLCFKPSLLKVLVDILIRMQIADGYLV